MKRAATVFTCINALAVIIMLLLIGYLYSALAVHHGQSAAAFSVAVLFIPVFAVINVIWMLVRRKLIDKQPFISDLHAVNDRKRICLNRLNKIGLLLNVLLFAAVAIHIIVLFVFKGVVDLIGTPLEYSLPFVLINDAWVVVFVNMDDRLDEKYQR